MLSGGVYCFILVLRYFSGVFFFGRLKTRGPLAGDSEAVPPSRRRSHPAGFQGRFSWGQVQDTQGLSLHILSELLRTSVECYEDAL